MTSSIAPVTLTRFEAELILDGLFSGNTVEQFAVETGSTWFTVDRHVRSIRAKIKKAILSPLPPCEGDIEQLGLSARVSRALRKHGVEGVAELRVLSREDLFAIRGIGELAVREIELLLGGV